VGSTLKELKKLYSRSNRREKKVKKSIKKLGKNIDLNKFFTEAILKMI
jgi:hypothetical protein